MFVNAQPFCGSLSLNLPPTECPAGPELGTDVVARSGILTELLEYITNLEKLTCSRVWQVYICA